MFLRGTGDRHVMTRRQIIVCSYCLPDHVAHFKEKQRNGHKGIH